MAAGFAALPLTAPRTGATGPFLSLACALFVLYLFACRLALGPVAGPGERRTVGAVFGFAILFRLILLPSAPALSDDLYRYRWDGRLTLAGLNPYAEPPEAPALAPLRDDLYEVVAHRDVRTIYPPGAQFLFAAGARLTHGVSGIKTLLAGADLLLLEALRRLLLRRGLPGRRVLIAAWNPLAVVEVAWSGHLEPAGTLLVLLAAAAIIQRRDVRASTLLALAGLVKLLPLALFAPLGRPLRGRAWLAAAAVLVAGYAPFLPAGARLFEGTVTYGRRWSGNGALFALGLAAIERLDPTPALKTVIAFLQVRLPGGGLLGALYPYLYPQDLARAACAAAALGVAAVLIGRRVEALRGAWLLTGALLLLSPTLHPWYLLWILPWLALFPSPAWILLSGLVFLVYANLGRAGPEAHRWVVWVEYVPFFLLLATDAFVARRRRC
jgi:alpha-1,6-mannosyltransferase